MSNDNLGASPASGGEELSAEYLAQMARRRAMPAPAAQLTQVVVGGLYGTDGANLFLIDTATGAASLIGPHGAVEVSIGSIAFSADGTLYGVSLTDAAQLYTINPGTGAATAVGPLGVGFVFEGGLSFDADGRLIGVDQGTAFAAKTFEIDTATGAATLIGPVNGQDRDLNGMATDGDIVFAIDRPSDTLGRVDVATGAYDEIGPTGAAIGDSGGLAYNNADRQLYATFASDGGFYRIDPSTGAATLIAVNNVDHGLSFAPSKERPKRYTYSVKFVCGVQREGEPSDTVLRPGRYSTEINIHNYHDYPVEIRKFVLPLVRNDVIYGREPDFTQIRAKDEITLPANTATMDDCYRLGQLLYGQVPQPMPLSVGFLELVTTAPVVVDAVYTASDGKGNGLTMDVERVEGRRK